MRNVQWCATLAGLLWAGSAHAEMQRVCLPELDGGLAVSIAVDPGGIVHLSRVLRVQGDLLYTVVEPGAEPVSSVVAPFMSQVSDDETQQTDIALVDGVPFICYRHSRRDEFFVAHLARGEWVREMVDEGEGVGDACSLIYDGETLHVLFRDEGALSMASRRQPDDWRVQQVDAFPGGDVGHQVDAIRLADGRFVAAHRDDANGNLRVSWRSPQGDWASETALQERPAGVRPRVVSDGAGGAYIVHGVQNPEESDGGLNVTAGPRGELVTSVFELAEVGETNGLASPGDGRIMLLTRERRRHAVFGAFDGLRLYRDLPADEAHEYLEQQDAARGRQEHKYIDLALGPFGNPIGALLVEFADRPGQRAGGFACVYREADRDGDRLPDIDEERFGTSPDDSDSDGDGMFDGDEILAGHNPNGAGDLPDPEPDPEPDPDMGVDPDPEPDPDMGPPPDPEPDPDPDMAAPDPDMAAPDPDMAAPEPDMAAPEPDMTPPDPDAAPSPDAGAEPDAAPPALDQGGAVDAQPEPEPPADADAPDPEPAADGGMTGGAGTSEGCSAGVGGLDGSSWPVVWLLGLLAIRRRR